ncbi:MAG: tRNA (adenosine(37)-N6)-threonylcarbamoyltransferase complex dimerization subunit type 1 TsaB [Clostridia bacterium]|nr:tRNA (adenosine(37)-N6)-threonylcarbamoyltransferase complex dimerization subunit type 1 TsaB [Clostridia bacterium]
MPTILAVDTSATPVSCAIQRDDRLLASYYAHTRSTHSQTLMPMIEHALKMNNMTMNDIDALAVNSCPGSFTGVRIGVSAVKGLAFADNKPCIEVSTLESMAEGFRGLPLDAVLCCVMDARCNQVYSAVFSCDRSGDITRLSEDEAITLDELKERLNGIEKRIIFVGDGAEICYNAFKDARANVSQAPLPLRYQSATGVASTAMRKLQMGNTLTNKELLPGYLRLPQAERELRSRLGKE